jgi:hypothetical protein
VRDTDTKEGSAERTGCRYQERGDADAKGCDIERPGMRISRESDADAKREVMLMPRGVILNDQG